MSKIRIAINGFGRIGRSVTRALLSSDKWPNIELVAINDIAPLKTCAYLFKYDSVFGPFVGKVQAGEGALIIDGLSIPFSSELDPGNLDLSDVDIFIECTGHARNIDLARSALGSGAARVLVSGPCANADLTLVLGANESMLRTDHKIISNASCTTNALAPLEQVLDAAFGIETGYMTTIHCYTGSQPTVDMPMGDLARSRAAALSMVPTTTSAQTLTDIVLPKLSGRILGSAVRVPTASVSAVDLTVMTRSRTSVESVNKLFAETGGVIGYEGDPLVSSDLRQRPESIIMAGDETVVTPGGMLRVFGWYDNEWGFSNRMLDVAALMAT